MATLSLVPWSWLAFVAATAGGTPGAPPKSAMHIELRSGGCDGAAPKALRYEAALARTEEEKERGLGFRDNKLAKHEAMLFAYDVPGPRTYWMKETHIPLAIFYFDAAGKLLSSAEMPVEPDPKNPIKLYPETGNVGAVVEVSPGATRTAKAHKLDTLCIAK